jgi:hypothetical protein
MLNGDSLDAFLKRADVLSRNDMFCLSNKKIGTLEGVNNIYLMHYAYSDRIPTKVQIQAAVNRDFGQVVVINPNEVLVGGTTLTIKAYSRYGLTEHDSPNKYVSNLKPMMEERPEAKLVEVGDVVRYFKGTVCEAQVVGYDNGEFTVRVGAEIERIAADDVIDVKESPKFHPTDQEAYDYFIQLYPKDFTKLLVDNNPKHFPVEPPDKKGEKVEKAPKPKKSAISSKRVYGKA